MAKEALKIWMELPADIRSKLLSNVWCGQCRTAVTICDYSTEFDGGVVVLRGFCGTCGHKVARVLEGCGESSKKRPNAGLDTTFLMFGFMGMRSARMKRKLSARYKSQEQKVSIILPKLSLRRSVFTLTIALAFTIIFRDTAIHQWHTNCL